MGWEGLRKMRTYGGMAACLKLLSRLEESEVLRTRAVSKKYDRHP